MGDIKARSDAIRRCGFAVVVSLGEDDVAQLHVTIKCREVAENSLAMHRADDYRERQSEGLN